MERPLAAALLFAVALTAGTARAADDEPNSPRKQATHPRFDDEPAAPRQQGTRSQFDDDPVTPRAQVQHAQKPRPRADQTVSVTFSPLALVHPVLEMTAEFRQTEAASGAVVAGAGQISQGGVSADVFELGGQMRGYPVGDFHNGLYIGLAAVYAHLSGTGRTSGVFNGLAAGPFGGFKLTAPAGLTFEAGIGWLVLLMADSGNDKGDLQVARFVLLDIGWSF